MPQLSAICCIGADSECSTMSTPIFSSPLAAPRTFSTASRQRSRATPPPGRMPSSTAARVACRASSTRAFFCFMSASVLAPTEMIATPPVSLASRSWNFSRSYSLSVASIWLRICWMRVWISAGLPAPLTIVVVVLVDRDLLGAAQVLERRGFRASGPGLR